MNISRKFALVALVAASLALSACKVGGHDVGGGDSPPPTTASSDLSHIYIVLQAPNAITALKVNAEARRLNSRAVARMVNGSPVATPDAVTETGCIGDSGLGNVISVQVDSYTIFSCGGVMMTVSIAPTADYFSVIAGPHGYQVFYEQPNCGGDGFTRASAGISGAGLVNGTAFWMDLHGTGLHDDSTTWMVAPGTVPTNNVNVVSFFDGDSCQASVATLDGLYAVVPADEAVTKWPNTPVPGPVLITHL
jgi:hypothetical protein